MVKVKTPHFIYQFNSDNRQAVGVGAWLLAAQLRLARFPHVVEARAHVAAKIVQPGIIDQNPDQHRQCGYTHGERRLNGSVSHLNQV